MSAYILPFEKLGRHDVDSVGGKNSSLGEMISHLANMGVSVPGGFATTGYVDLPLTSWREVVSNDIAALATAGPGQCTV